MLYGIEKINEVIEYIEGHLGEPISCGELARIALLSEYEFRRVFSFIIGTPVAEYIRKRKLSVAAEELKSSCGSVSEIGARYGYDSASSFTRAFKETFGVSPQEAKDPSVKLCIFTRPRLEFSVRGARDISYTEKPLDAFSIEGVRGESSLSDTCCCESVWATYEESDATTPTYAAYVNGKENVICYVGKKVDFGKQGDAVIDVAAGKWVCFDVSAEASEREINDLYEQIIFSFLPSGIYRRDDSRPNVETFEENGDFVIMIPVTGKE